ncbi:MAG: hypothetical protein HUK03_10625, partial [Bacteroidaceae bacterium]|nr:hypothetical protein [Bacteroidaceae bacterium]
KVALPSILDGMNKGMGYGRDTHMDMLIPDGCGEAAHFFQMGCYQVQIEAAVGSDGKLELGVYRGGEGVKGQDWIVVDNFRLQYLTSDLGLPEDMYMRNQNTSWAGDKMELVDDTDELTRHFRLNKYVQSNRTNGTIFNFAIASGKGGADCWGPSVETYVKAGDEVSDFGNYGDKCYVFQNQTGYIQVDVYVSATPNLNKVVFTDKTMEAMADKDALYVVGEQTTGWSRESSVCQKLNKTSEGVYEGTIEVKRDNTIFDAIRFASVADNGDDDNYIGLAFDYALGNGTYDLCSGSAGRVYLRKGKVNVNIDFNTGKLTTSYAEVAPSYVYAVGTLVDHVWQNTDTSYKLEEVEPGVFKGIVKVGEDSDSR